MLHLPAEEMIQLLNNYTQAETDIEKTKVEQN